MLSILAPNLVLLASCTPILQPLSAALPVDPELRLSGSLAPLADAVLNGRSDPVNAPSALASAPRSFFVLHDRLL